MCNRVASARRARSTGSSLPRKTRCRRPVSLRVSLRKLIDRRDTNERHPLTITPLVSFNPHRKKKALHKTTSTDDKRLTNTLKRLGVNVIPGIEEVNIFKDDDVVHFTNPKVQASIAANTYVVSGPSQTKKLQDMLPGIINQLGPDNLAHLKKIAQAYQAGGDDVPAVENFEAGK